MARRGSFSATFNGVRYLLFALGVLMLIGSCAKTEGRTSDDTLAFAWFCIAVGIPLPLLALPFRFVLWLLGLFRISKPAPAAQVKVTVEWGDEPATDKQLGFIRHVGGKPPDGLTKSAASDMIDALLAEKRGRT